MELKSTINIILKDLEDARALIDDLRNYQGVPLIQIELARAKCRSAEDVIRLLSSLLEEKMAVTPEQGAASSDYLGTEEAVQAGLSGEEIYEIPETDRLKVAGSSDRGETEEHRSAKSADTENNHSSDTTEAQRAEDHLSAEAPVIKEQLSSGEQVTGDQETGDLVTGDQESKDQVTEDQVSEDQATGDQVPEDQATGDQVPEDKVPEDKVPEDKVPEDQVPEDQATGDSYSEKGNNQVTPQPEKISPRIVADRFSHLSERINEQIGDSKNGSHGSTRIKKNITDITREIGINDRFFLIREMFGGNQERYASAINELNSVKSNEEAKQIIERYSTGSGDKEAGRMLAELVKRKLSSTHG